MKLSILATFFTAMCASMPLLAEDAGVSASPVVVRVGDRTVTQETLEKRLNLSRLQLDIFGKNDAEIRRVFVSDIVVPELLFSMYAREKNTDPAFKDVLAQATKHKIYGDAEKSVTPEDVRAEYELHRTELEPQEQVLLWRILCKTKSEAEGVLAKAKKSPTKETYFELARENSIDKSSYLRGGNIGFIKKDGTGEGGVRVPKSFFEESLKLKDGEFISKPLEEEGGFAVVWKRGSVKPPKETDTFKVYADSLRRKIAQKRYEAAEKQFISEKKKTVTIETHEELLEKIEFQDLDAGLFREIKKSSAR